MNEPVNEAPDIAEGVASTARPRTDEFTGKPRIATGWGVRGVASHRSASTSTDERGITRAQERSVPVTMPEGRRGARQTQTALPPASEPALVTPDLPPDLAHRLTDNDVAAFGSAARRLGLSGQQAQAILDLYAERVRVNADTNRRPTRGETVTVLQQEWGDALPRKLAAANRAVEALGGERLREHLRRTGLSNDEHLVRLFADLGERMTREQVERARVSRGASVDRETVLIEYDRRMRDPEDPYWKANHPDHKRAVAEMTRLSQVVYGAAPVPDPNVAPPTPRKASLPAGIAIDLAAEGVEANAILNRWYSDRSHPVNNRHDPRHNEAVEIAHRLHAIAGHRKNVDARQLADALFRRARQPR